MKSLRIDESERSYLTEMRALGADSQGCEVLVGLSRAESEWYLAYLQRVRDDCRDPDDSAKYLQLHETHERCRMGILGAEAELRDTKPVRH